MMIPYLNVLRLRVVDETVLTIPDLVVIGSLDLVVIAIRLKWIHKLLSKCSSDSDKIEKGYIYCSLDLVVIGSLDLVVIALRLKWVHTLP